MSEQKSIIETINNKFFAKIKESKKFDEDNITDLITIFSSGEKIKSEQIEEIVSRDEDETT